MNKYLDLNQTMAVKITIQDNEWNNLWSFLAEENKSFSSMAKQNDIEIMTSCGAGACGICKCKIIEWYDYIQIDKMWNPLWELPKDEYGITTTIFTCIAWVKSKYLKDDKQYEIVLRRNI
jgi:ferredoxin